MCVTGGCSVGAQALSQRSAAQRTEHSAVRLGQCTRTHLLDRHLVGPHLPRHCAQVLVHRFDDLVARPAGWAWVARTVWRVNIGTSVRPLKTLSIRTPQGARALHSVRHE